MLKIYHPAVFIKEGYNTLNYVYVLLFEIYNLTLDLHTFWEDIRTNFGWNLEWWPRNIL